MSEHHDLCTKLYEVDDYQHHARPDDPEKCDYCKAFTEAYEQGKRDAVAAVEALPHDPDCRSYRGGSCSCPWRVYLIAAIKGVK